MKLINLKKLDFFFEHKTRIVHFSAISLNRKTQFHVSIFSISPIYFILPTLDYTPLWPALIKGYAENVHTR